MKSILSKTLNATLGITLCGVAGVANAGPIAIYLNGIGVNVPNAVSAANSATSAWAPGSGADVSFVAEDSVGGSGYVGPGYGGQPYDLEALYVQRDGTQLTITGISGASLAAMPVGSSGACSSSSACYTFPIGDFFIGTGSTSAFNPLMGIEVTGQHYLMHATQGTTIGWDSPLAAGSIVGVTPGTPGNQSGYELGLAAWNYVGAPSQLAASGWSLQPGAATVSWEMLNGHAAFQASMDVSSLGSLASSDFIVHWGELCGNDFLRTSSSVPEPASLSLFGLGLAGLAAARRRKRAGAKPA